MSFHNRETGGFRELTAVEVGAVAGGIIVVNGSSSGGSSSGGGDSTGDQSAGAATSFYAAISNSNIDWVAVIMENNEGEETDEELVDALEDAGCSPGELGTYLTFAIGGTVLAVIFAPVTGGGSIVAVSSVLGAAGWTLTGTC